MDDTKALTSAEKLGRAAYAGYGSSTDYKKFDGTPMLHWDKLPANIQEAWNGAGVAAAGCYADLEAKAMEARATERVSMDSLDAQGVNVEGGMGKTDAVNHCGQDAKPGECVVDSTKDCESCQ